jgi:hypothetical protein
MTDYTADIDKFIITTRFSMKLFGLNCCRWSLGQELNAKAKMHGQNQHFPKERNGLNQYTRTQTKTKKHGYLTFIQIRSK